MPTTGPYRGRRWDRLEYRSIRNASRQSEPWDASWDHCHDQSLRFAMAPGTAEDPLSRIDQHLLYIGPVPARTGRPNGYRTRSNEVRGAAQPPLPTTPFRWKATSHPQADQQTAGARRHQGIAGQHLQEKDDCLVAGIDSWNLFSQPHPLVRFLSDGHMCLMLLRYAPCAARLWMGPHRSAHPLVHERLEDVALFEDVAYIREEIGQDPLTSLKLEGAPLSLEPIPMSCMVRSTGLIWAVLERSARQARYRDPGGEWRWSGPGDCSLEAEVRDELVHQVVVQGVGSP
jgi:hypothetical protein